MSRTHKGSKPVGYEYWSKRPGNKCGNLLGADKFTKKLTHSRERLRGNRLQYAHKQDDEALRICDEYDSHPQDVQL